MSHWLDGLFGTEIEIEWDGTLLPSATILAFGEQFEVAHDSSNGRNAVTIRFIELDGDVTGDSDENRVTTISGDEEENRVDMECTRLVWDPSASEGEPEIRVSTGELDGGALEITHNDERVILFSAGGVEIGGEEVTSVNQLIGGLRLTLRSINTNINLDTTTTDTIAWIDAASEHTVRLPTPSVGRVVLFPVDGSSTTTIQRNASEQINGVAGNYVMPLDDDGGIGIAIADGTNWIARVIRYVEESSGGGLAPMFFSPVDFLTSMNVAPTAATGGDQTMGTYFYVLPGVANVEITGVRFYWAGAAATVRCRLWAPSITTAAPQASVDVAVGGPGYYTATFASPYALPTNQYNRDLVVSTYDVGANLYTWIGGSTTEIGAHLPARPFLAGTRVGYRYFNRFAGGSSYPVNDGGNEWNIIEPVIQEV